MSPEEHKKEILKAAAKFIKSDSKSSSFNTDRETYCKLDDLTADSALESLPESLQYLCCEMFVGKQNERKAAVIGQSIMQCIRPRAIVAPLQIGLAVQMHIHFPSRYLIDVLHSFGFCASYNEVQRFERNAAMCRDDAIKRRKHFNYGCRCGPQHLYIEWGEYLPWNGHGCCNFQWLFF